MTHIYKKQYQEKNCNKNHAGASLPNSTYFLMFSWDTNNLGGLAQLAPSTIYFEGNATLLWKEKEVCLQNQAEKYTPCMIIVILFMFLRATHYSSWVGLIV